MNHGEVKTRARRRIQFYTDDHLARELNAIATAMGTSVSGLLNVLVRHTLASRGTAYMTSARQVMAARGRGQR
jgi:hypothetical protein